MGIFDFLKRKQKHKEKISVELEIDMTKEKPYKHHYIEPKKAGNYTGKELIHLNAWLTDVKDINPDGTSRQEILAKCSVGDALTFRVLQISLDYFIIEVYCEDGCIGVINDVEMQIVATYINNGGVMHNAVISELIPPKTSRGKISCKISFSRNKMR